jgi:hypothetical protein
VNDDVRMYRVECDDCQRVMLKPSAGRWICTECSEGRGHDVRFQSRGVVVPLGDVSCGGGDWA